MSLASQIKVLGEKIGLDIVRITSTKSFPEAEKHIVESAEKGYIPENDYYASKNIPERPNQLNLNKISKRCNPRSILKRAKSIISVAQCYLIEETEDIQDKNQLLGKIAKYDIGNFYYDVKLKLKKIVDFINQETDSKYKSKNKSCYISLTEKPIAQRAGVGWYCTICIDSCPTKAIVSPYVIDRTKCLQFISERVMKVPLAFREKWEDRLYGCTTCQEVCPQNREVRPKKYKPEYGYIGSRIPLIPLLQISEGEFQNYFAYNQIAMRPKEAIKRNAILALGNIGDPWAVVPLIKVLQEDDNSIVRGHTAWALGKIGGEKAKFALEKVLKSEEDREVREEIANALRMI
jgi:epoxyqueuosine reductase